MDKVEHSLRKTTQAVIQKNTSSLPTTVEDACEKILGRLKESQRADAEILLHLVVGARRPLTLSEMNVAFQLATDAPNIQGHDDLELHEERLKSEIRRICGLDFQARDNIFEQYLPEISAKNYPLINYASKHWPAYARGVDPGDEVTQNLIYELYNSHEPDSTFWWRIKAHYASGRRDDSKNCCSETWLASLEAKDACGRTPLFIACESGQSEIVRMLLKEGADVDSRASGCPHYTKPLQVASRGGHSDIAQMLLDKGADINEKDRGDDGHALIAAVCRDSIETVQMLLDNGADVNAQGGLNGKAFRAASFKGHTQIMQMLLVKCADSDQYLIRTAQYDCSDGFLWGLDECRDRKMQLFTSDIRS
ncbi:ankyrin repeat-containing domain protein [Colletotrichum godetiae]|uniref:Ankyrin repeat-containing domain protein n=1 Tax=Colletotrichum godetiae TaxID=1209918 RepID=A0AAJ0AQY3_9PEZI|nr:ankyrin repeat-containing domain protein [Colletotrichum godetiae]KAK1676877.1 ankyrin repeat-containing domain protein [Colletotrichum godetiae]